MKWISQLSLCFLPKSSHPDISRTPPFESSPHFLARTKSELAPPPFNSYSTSARGWIHSSAHRHYSFPPTLYPILSKRRRRKDRQPRPPSPPRVLSGRVRKKIRIAVKRARRVPPPPPALSCAPLMSLRNSPLSLRLTGRRTAEIKSPLCGHYRHYHRGHRPRPPVPPASEKGRLASPAKREPVGAIARQRAKGETE